MFEAGVLQAMETETWESRGRPLRRKLSSMAKSLRISKGFKGVSTFSKQFPVRYVQKKKSQIFTDCSMSKKTLLVKLRRIFKCYLHCVTPVICTFTYLSLVLDSSILFAENTSIFLPEFLKLQL